MPLRELHIFDCDGVLADSSHRYRTLPGEDRIDLDHWRANECRTSADAPGPYAPLFRELRARDQFCVIATARIWCQQSADWALYHLGGATRVIARKDADDPRGGAQLKISGLRSLMNLKQFSIYKERPDLITVYEDNARYLHDLCHAFRCKGIFVPSVQGH